MFHHRRHPMKYRYPRFEELLTFKNKIGEILKATRHDGQVVFLVQLKDSDEVVLFCSELLEQLCHKEIIRFYLRRSSLLSLEEVKRLRSITSDHHVPSTLSTLLSKQGYNNGITKYPDDNLNNAMPVTINEKGQECESEKIQTILDLTGTEDEAYYMVKCTNGQIKRLRDTISANLCPQKLINFLTNEYFKHSFDK